MKTETTPEKYGNNNRMLLENGVAIADCGNTADAQRIAEMLNGAAINEKRLMFLIEREAYVSHSRDGEVCNVWFSDDPKCDNNGPVPVEGYPQRCYHDPLEAIDNAIAATAPRPA